MTKITLTNIGAGTAFQTAISSINANNDILETALDNTLSRDGTAPNAMGSSLDMNSNRVLNLPDAISNQEPLTLSQASILNGNGTISITLPTGGTTNQVLKKNSNTNYDVGWGVAAGTVTSVGLSFPSDFVITGSPVTTSGTLTANWLVGPTGTGALVRATTPTIATAILTSPTMTTPVLGIPVSGTLTNCTGLPIATGLSGLAANVATFLGTPSSVNLRTAVTDPSGTGLLLFQNGDLGTPNSGTMTNVSGTAASLTAGTATNAINSGITNDVATNATMFPVWVTANAGNLALKVSSTVLTFNPSTKILTGNLFNATGGGNGFRQDDRLADGTNQWLFYAISNAWRIFNTTDGVDWFTIAKATGLATFAGGFGSTSPTGGFGYFTGSGGSVTQLTNRNTNVTLNKVSGAITLFSQVNAAVSGATATRFTVNNSTVAATDSVIVSQKSGTDRYLIYVTNVAAGSFTIEYFSPTGGTTNEAPVFNYSVVKGALS